ncbi:MAG: cation:proton antiporter [Gammaproteobacteria bacterium]|nr:cation:proton antiporter [Gammaproteobacteria bacterium]NNK97452.1 potassium transporter Kef [Xanthomonadales bacterium]
MSFDWIAIALSDVAWITLAFFMGLAARFIGLPPLIGFLATGFLLNAQGIVLGEFLDKLSDLGITLLLFLIGLKLDVRALIRPHVWGVASIHMVIVTVVFTGLLFLFAALGLPLVTGLDVQTAWLVAFALSFSSTVFVVKLLEERGDINSLHGRISVGVLIVQDIAAVLFLAASMGKLPSIWALGVIAALFLLRRLFYILLIRVGHGELLVLYGIILALGGAEVFEMVGLKGDLGALILGTMIAAHPRSDELSKVMTGFKDLFLLGFFLSIGMGGIPSPDMVLIALLLVPLVALKSGLFFVLFTRFRLRARTAVMAGQNLGQYSEFGLIVASVSVANGWLGHDCLIVLSLAVAFSFIGAAVFNRPGDRIYSRHREFWNRFQARELMADEQHVRFGEARIVIVGIGGVGSGAYDHMEQRFPGQVLGIDVAEDHAQQQLDMGRNVIQGDPTSADFWDRVRTPNQVEMIMLTLPSLATSLAVLRQLDDYAYGGTISAVARYPDEIPLLEAGGAALVFNIYTEAGTGFAEHVMASAKLRS